MKIVLILLTLAAFTTTAWASTEQPPSCEKVPAKRYNQGVHVLKAITGKRPKFADSRVCKARYNALRRKVRSARAICLKHAHTAVASVYGPTHGDGRQTASGVVLGDYTVGVAHKTLPFFSKFYFHYGRRTKRAPVLDRGPFVAGREWDLTEGLRVELGFPVGVDSVTTSKHNCWAVWR